MKRFLVVVLIIGFVFFTISFLRIQKEKSGQRVAVLMEDVAFKEARNQYIAYQVGIYTGPQAIIEKAQAQGLVAIEPSKIIVLEKKDEHKKKN